MRILNNGNEDFLGLDYSEVDYLLYLICDGSEEEKCNAFDEIMACYGILGYRRSKKYPGEYEESYYMKNALMKRLWDEANWGKANKEDEEDEI